MYQGKRSAFMLLLAGMFVGLIGLVACGGGGGSSSSGGTLPQTSIAPTATLDGWTPNDSTLVQYKTYTFAASATDPNIGGSISEFRWDFGDGTTKTTPVVLSGGKATTTVTYSYVTSGTPTLSVVAKNAAGLLSTAATKSLTVGTSPSPLTVTFVSPKAATLVNAVLGNKVTLTYTVNVVYTGFGTVSASGITLDPGEASATQTAPVDAGSGNYTITVTYSAASAIGSRTVTPSVKVVDSNGVSSTTVLGPAITIKTVSATNTAPIITLTSDAKPSAGPNATWQNVDVVFTAVASDPDSDPLTYTWDLGDGTVVTGSTQLTQTHKYSKAGLYSVKVTADDGRAGGTKTADLTLNVLGNVPPTVVVTKTLPSGNPTKYQRVTLNAAVTDTDTTTVTWNFGDGSASATGNLVTHQFLAAGLTNVTATADDGKGGIGTGSIQLTIVENNPPVASVTTAPASLYQNKVYTFDATASDLDATDTIASYEWDFGDGVVVVGTGTQAHVFPPTVSGLVPVKARAIDSRGAVGDWSPAVTFTVVVTKLPVVAFTVGDKATFNATTAAQVIAEFLVSVTNPNGAAGTYLLPSDLTVTAGDSAGTVGTIINHQDGTYTIPVTYLAGAPARTVTPSVTALDGLQISSNVTVASATVNTVAAVNVTPVATLVSAPKIAAGTNATWTGVDVVFTATGSDPDSDPLVYTWEFGDGTVLTGMLGSAALTQTHNYTTAGNYSVKLTADDGRLNGTKTADLTLSVLANAAPTVVVTKVSPGGNPTKYQRVTLNAAVTDTDTTTVTWNFGDGSASATGNLVTHQFLAAGLTNVTATADDGKGGIGTGSIQLTIVENNPPVTTVTPTAPVSPLYQNKSYTFTATASDPDSDAIDSFEWDFGNGVVVAGGASQAHTFPPTVVGVVLVKARAIDHRGAVGDWSPVVNFTVATAQLPVVTFTSPAVSLSLNVGSYIDQDILFSVTNPNASLGATIPLPGGIAFSANDGAATVPAGVVSLGGTSYKATVRYSAAGSSGSRSNAPSASAQDSLSIPAVPVAVSGAPVTIVTGTFGKPTIGVTIPSTSSNTAYASASIALRFTLGNPTGNPTTYTVDWDSVGHPGVTTTSATISDPLLATTGVVVDLTHSYATVGTYKIAITAFDNRSISDSTRTADPQYRDFVIGTNALPTATITSPQSSGTLPALASIQNGGQGIPTIPAGATDPDVVVIPANGKLVFSGTGTQPDSGGAITYSWTFNGGVPNSSTLQSPGEVFFPGVASQITAYRVDLTVTDNLGRPSVNSAKARSKWVVVDASNTQDFHLSFMYRQKSDSNLNLVPTIATKAANGLGAQIQVFQDGVTNTWSVVDASGTEADKYIPVRSDLPFWIKIPSGVASDARAYFMRIPNAPTGAYADATLGSTLDTSTSSYGFASGSAPWNPALQIVTAQGFAPEVDAAAQRKLQGLYSLALPTPTTTADTFWLNRMSAPFAEGVITGLNGNAGFSGITAYQSFAEWPIVLEAKPTGATGSLTSTTGSTDLAFNLDYGKYQDDATTSASYGITAMQAFRAPKGSTDPYDLTVAGWGNASAKTTLTSTAAALGVGTYFGQMITASVGITRLTGGLTGLSIPYDANDPDRTVIAPSTRNLTGIRSVFSYAEYLWTKVWAWPLVLNSSQLKDVANLSTSTAFYRYSVPPTSWPKYLGTITPDSSSFNLNVSGGATFAPQTSSPVALSGTPGTAGVGRFFWTVYTPWYNSVPGSTIARTWLADASGQPPTTQSGSATGDATAALGFVPPQDTVVDKRGRNSDGSLSGDALGGYRVTWFNATKDEGGNPVPPDFWVVELVANGETRHFLLPGSFPATYPTYSPSGLPNPEAIAILTDARVAMTRQSDSKPIVAPGYCWFDVPLELRPAARSSATLTVFALKSVLANNAPTGARALNRPEWIDAIKTAAANMIVKGSNGTLLTDIYKIPFNYYWDIVITNGPATPVAP